MKIVEYSEEKAQDWDEFVLNMSINGTFLQTRRFLNYHPVGRFEDESLMVYNEKGHIVAVVPGCQIKQNNEKVFFSHKGSTFGGIIVARKFYKAKYVDELVYILKEYWLNKQFQKVILKQTSEIFCVEHHDLIDYILYKYGFQSYYEINTYVEFENYKMPLISNLSQGKRTNVHNCEKAGMYVRTLEVEQEILEFYDILCENLDKYGVKPVHTVKELIEFKNERLLKECDFYGAFLDDEMVAGGMMFYFNNSLTAHTQYLAAKADYNKLSPMTFMYYSIIKEMYEKGFNKLSWGIATENLGKDLNLGLITSKESFGSTYCNNMTYIYEQ